MVPKKQTRWLIVLMGVIVFVCYLPTLKNGFVWDDYHNLVENQSYRGLSISHLHWMFTTFHDANYHPLAWMTLGFDFVLWGVNPAGYHLTNLVLHILNTILFYYLIVIFIRQSNSIGPTASLFIIQVGAVVGALFFSIHPLRVEPVAIISSRSDVLCGFFYLLTMIAYLRMVDVELVAERRKWFLFALLFFVLSLLSRAWGITLPIVLLILDVYPLRRFGLKDRSKALNKKVLIEKIPFVMLALSTALLALLAKKGSMLQVAQHGLLDRFMQATYGLCFYLWKTALPVNLSPLYLLEKAFNPLAPKYIFCTLAVFSITAGLIVVRSKWPWALSSWACYGVIVSPLLGFVQSGPQIVADRYTYIACMPFGILVGAGMVRLWIAWHKEQLSSIVWFIAKQAIWVGLLILAVLSFRQIRIWHDNRTFWNYVLEIDPANYIAYNNRGVFLKEHVGDLALARSDFTNAIDLNQEFVDPYYNRGLILEHQGDIVGAVSDYTRVVQLDPENENAYNNRGGLLKKQGNLSGALADFNTAIRLNPSSPEGYANRGVLWLAQNDFKRALQDLNKALEVADANWVYRAEVEKILENLQAKLIEDDPSAGLQ